MKVGDIVKLTVKGLHPDDYRYPEITHDREYKVLNVAPIDEFNFIIAIKDNLNNLNWIESIHFSVVKNHPEPIFIMLSDISQLEYDEVNNQIIGINGNYEVLSIPKKKD